VDNNTTFLAHYDEHPHDNLKGVRAIGNQKSFYFNGATRIDTAFRTDNMPQITVECWIYPARNTTTDTYISSAESAGISFECVAGKPQLAVNTGGSYKVAASTEQLGVNQWYHLAGVYDGTNVIMYVNGVAKATVACTGVITASSQKITLAANPPGTGSPYQGRMSNARLWNFGLSQAQVVAAMNNQLTDGIVAHWKLDEGAGSVVYDCSGGGNDGVVSGTVSWAEGQAVYSLLSGGYSGGTGKGVFAEEGTTNIITKPLDPSTWGINKDPAYGYVSHSIIDTEFGVQGLRKTVQKTATTDYRGTLNTIPWATPTDMTQTYSFSIYARLVDGPATSITLNYEGKDASNVRKDVTQIFTVSSSDWTRYTLTATPSNSSFATIITTMKVYVNPTGADGTNVTVDIVMPQMEQKSYPTSFVEGTRSMPYLAYPKSIVNPAEGTISFWMNPVSKNPNTYPSIMGLGGWTADNSKDWMSVYWGSGWGSANQVSFGLVNGTDKLGINQSVTGMAINPNSWLFIVARWSFNTDKYAITTWDSLGVKREITGALTFNPPVYADSTAFYVGCSKDWNSTSAPNAEFDELRIDNVYRSDAEIASWYYQGRNGW
jgi:hypothetical protein